jgi:hypothetical protein
MSLIGSDPLLLACLATVSLACLATVSLACLATVSLACLATVSLACSPFLEAVLLSSKSPDQQFSYTLNINIKECLGVLLNHQG